MTDVNKIQSKKYGGIYYTNILTGDSEADNLICSKIVGTSDVDLIDERINEVTAKNLKADEVLARSTV